MVVNLSQTINMTIFSKKLKERMAERAISQKDLAFDIRVDPSLISKVLNGRLGAPESLLYKLAAYTPLDLTFEQLRVWQLLEDIRPQEVPYLEKELKNMYGRRGFAQ